MIDTYYKVHLTDGRTFDFEDYQYLIAWWAAHCKQGVLSHVTVHDIEVSSGFGN